MTNVIENGRYYGAVLGMQAVDDLTLAETTYAPGASVPAHAHANPLFCLVVRGGFQERSWHKPLQCDAGSVLFHPRNEAHAHHFDATESRCLTVTLGPDWLSQLEAVDVRIPGDPFLMARGRGPWLGHRLYLEFARRSDSSGLTFEDHIVGLLSELDSGLSHSKDRSRSLVRRAREYLDAHYREPLRLAAVASVAGVHPAHLSRAFRALVGCTMGDYVQARRIERARELLAGDDAVSAIALETGFADQSHFSRRFKRLTGMTPGEYRESVSPRGHPRPRV